MKTRPTYLAAPLVLASAILAGGPVSASPSSGGTALVDLLGGTGLGEPSPRVVAAKKGSGFGNVAGALLGLVRRSRTTKNAVSAGHQDDNVIRMEAAREGFKRAILTGKLDNPDNRGQPKTQTLTFNGAKWIVTFRAEQVLGEQPIVPRRMNPIKFVHTVIKSSKPVYIVYEAEPQQVGRARRGLRLSSMGASGDHTGCHTGVLELLRKKSRMLAGVGRSLGRATMDVFRFAADGVGLRHRYGHNAKNRLTVKSRRKQPGPRANDYCAQNRGVGADGL